MPRIAAIDYGTKRVGLAVTDPLGLFAQPVGTFDAKGAVDELQRLAQGTGADALTLVLVGWPLLPDGTEGSMVQKVRPYLNRLRNALPGVRVEPYDERTTSRRAQQALLEAGASKKGRRDKARLNAAAAAVLLQDYLDEVRG
ncbi:MAG: Holliday junction resolvase RuvX [Bacteroidota bacterium]